MKKMNRLGAMVAVLAFAITVLVPIAAFAENELTVSITEPTVNLKIGDTYNLSNLTVTVQKDDETLTSDDYALEYAVTDGSSATIANGTATATAEGNTTVTVTATGSGDYADTTGTATVTVKVALYGAPITTVEPTNPYIGEEITLTAKPASGETWPAGTQVSWGTPSTGSLESATSDVSNNQATVKITGITAASDITGLAPTLQKKATPAVDWSRPGSASITVAQWPAPAITLEPADPLPGDTVTATIKPPSGRSWPEGTKLTITQDNDPEGDKALTPGSPVTIGATNSSGVEVTFVIPEDAAAGNTVKLVPALMASNGTTSIASASTGATATVRAAEYAVSISGGTQVAANGTLDLTATSTGTDPLPDGTTYAWTVVGGGTCAPDSGTTAATTLTAPEQEGTIVVKVTATPPTGTAVTASVNVKVTAEPASTGTPSAEPSSDASASSSPSSSVSSSQQPSPSASTEPTLPPAEVSPVNPSAAPSAEPSASTSAEPSSTASAEASESGSNEPSSEPTGDASGEPSAEPSSVASGEPSAQPSAEPNTPADEVPIEPAEDAPVDFEISDNPDGSGSVLTGIDVATNNEQTGSNAVENLIDSIQVPAGQSVEVVDKDGEPVELGDPAATGMIVRVVDESGNVISTTAVVVKGDVLGTGEMSLTQLVRTASAFIGDEPLTGAYLMAGDLAGDDGAITLTDLVRMAALYKAFTEGA